jgi:serine/threonine-protein kinase
MKIKPSRTRIGPYEIAKLLGIAEPCGEIFLARDTRLDCVVVIRELWSRDPELRASFAREIEVLAAHRHVTGVHDVVHDNGRHYLVLDYFEGETLAARSRKGLIPVDEGLNIARQLAEALDAAHGLGIVHRNLKPEKVLLTNTGVKLFDFGLPTLRLQPIHLPGINVAATVLTLPTAVCRATVATVQYLSPEQLQGQEPDARSDIWAFGCVVYAMLTGRPPFSGTRVESVIAAVLSAEPDALTNTDASPGIASIVTKCLRKSPAERWQNVRDAARALMKCNTGPRYWGLSRILPGRP